jgi:hypothetical protein
MNNTIALILLVFFVPIAGLPAFGGREDGKPKPQPVEATGRVRMVGSSPLSSLVLSGENREWYIEAGEQEKLMRFQQQTVTVRGREYYEDLTFANGISAGRRYYLKDIKIIKTAN